LEGDGLRRGRRGAPASAREQAPRQDLDPRRRDRRGGGQAGGRARRDPRRGGRVVADGSANGRLEVVYIDWPINPFRAERWHATWEPAAARAMSFGAKGWSLTRNEDDPLHFRQASIWEDHADFERYWYSDEVSATREEAVNFYNKPVLPVWHSLIA